MNLLKLLDFEDSRGTPIDGLLRVDGYRSAESPHERAILDQAASFKANAANGRSRSDIDCVFFRRFKDPKGRHIRSSQIAAYVVDNSQSRLSEEDLARLHHKLWLHGAAPLLYVAWPTRIDILSCARKADFWDGGAAKYRHADRIVPPARPAIAIQTAGRIADAFQKLRDRYSAHRLSNGTFWDDPDNQKLAKADAAAHRSLIQAIVEADRSLRGDKHPMRRRLLLLVVLIKYLEDRGVLKPSWYGRFHAGARSVRDILIQGTADDLRSMLRYLEKKFNGDVFSLGDDDGATTLCEDDLQPLGKLVGAKTLGGQSHFWDLFDFKHIPVEVISRLYQRFVTGTGAVYTPPLLASLLLDQVMPYDRLSGKERVLDPACGSGVFLVGAFKRLIVHWRDRNHWREPSADVLKRILTCSIHGVEMESDAVDLAAFSLSLALCDALSPPVIWSSLKFEKLRGRNLRIGDFFAPATFADNRAHDWPDKFDVIVGNPPFQSELTPAAEAFDKSVRTTRPTLPDKNIAYLFLDKGLQSLASRGTLCLIQPHGLLYNSTTNVFRRHLMSICRLHSVLDFVSMRGLFEGADPKTIAWHSVHAPNKYAPVNHLTFRRTYASSERIAFEIDHYDWHEVSEDQARYDPHIWRVNLLGGGRLHQMSERLRSLRTLATFVAEKGSTWDYGEGYVAGKRGTRTPAPFLTGRQLLPTRAFTQHGIDWDRIDRDKDVVSEVLFRSPYSESRYSPPLILIKAHISLPIELWDRGFIAYKDKIIGIHAPRSDAGALRALYELLTHQRRFFQFYCALNGTQALTGKATVPLKQDLDLIPVPEELSELDLCPWEDALKEDVLDYLGDYVRLGQDSKLLRKSARRGDVALYSSFFLRMLGSLHRNLKAADPVFLNGLIAQPFYFGSRPDVSWLGSNCEEALQRLIYERTSDALRTVRVVRYYDGNVLLIVKPDRLRYWIRSTAIRDADDTLDDLRRQGW